VSTSPDGEKVRFSRGAARLGSRRELRQQHVCVRSGQASEGRVRVMDEMPIKALYAGVGLGSLALIALAWASVPSISLPRAALLALLGVLWVWIAGVIVSECVGRTNWSPLSGMTLIAVTILISLAGGLEDTPRTTIVACVVQGGWAWWAHAGDSRLYLVRKGAIAARTLDHTVVQQWVDAGALDPALVRGHPQRNLLVQCLGGARAPRVDAVGRARLERDDIVLLCTDGFWEPLHDRQIVAGLESGSVAEGITRLAGLARERAGAESDNISALAFAWDETAVPLGEGMSPGPDLEPLGAAQEIDAPDPDILAAMLEDPESGIARIRRSLEDGGRPA